MDEQAPLCYNRSRSAAAGTIGNPALMRMILYIAGGILLMYLLFTLFLTYLVQQIPRNPVQDTPDWGKILHYESI